MSAEDIKQVSILDAVKHKSMFAGALKPSPHEEYILNDNKFIKKTITYSDCLFKIFDEPLVNVVDASIKLCSMPKKYRVTTLIIEFKNGYISLFNNGQGFPITLKKNLEGKEIYSPELAATNFFAGSNHDVTKEKITGGVNGVGLSITNAHSKHFVLETVDLKLKKHYYQECHNGLEVIDPPKITTLSKLDKKNVHKKGGTTIKFLPNYSTFNFDLKNNNHVSNLNKIFKARALQIAAHTDLKVIYNGERLLECKKNESPISKFSKLFMNEDEFVHTKIKHEKYDWDVVIGLTDGGGFESLSIINGIHVKTGVHINYIRDQVINAIKPKVIKLLKKFKTYKKSMVQNNLFIIISGNIPNPSFDSQTKTNLSGSVSKYKSYVIQSKTINKIWKILEPRLVEQFLTNPLVEKKTRKVSTNKIKKYTKAKYAGTRKSSQCSLLICEGDSADALPRSAFTSKKVNMSYDYYGSYIIGGVPINSRTKSDVYESKNGKRVIRRQKQLIDNERLDSLSKVLNLDLSKDYKTKEQLSTLNYGRIVVTVDQDLDGVGQIFGLILSHFALFWPELIKIGYIKQLATPIIRAFPKSGKSLVESFYTDDEYRQWVIKKFKGGSPTNWVIKYYKGLATHSDEEAINIFQNFDKSLNTITWDELADKTFDVYYGKDPDKRKKELKNTDFKQGHNLKNISCTSHLKSHTKEFQLDNIQRKLPDIYDGLNPARRKVVHGSRKKFLTNNAEIKVFQLAGYIAEHMNYHHGSASLEKTMITIAQSYIGARNLPLLLPLSQFGSRYRGGKDHGASRYIKTKLNKDLVSVLFNKEDDYLLEYTRDEGVINEPVYYVPIAPLSIMESLELPATGWKFAGYARDWNKLYKILIKLIKKYTTSMNIKKISLPDLPFWKNNWNGEIRETKNGKWFVGKYKYNSKNNTIKILELPYQIWNEPWSEKIKLKSLVVSVDDNSSKKHIDISVKLKPGGYKKILEIKSKEGFSPVEEYFLLRKKISKNLNMFKDGTVYESKSYKEILLIWFKKRYDLYVKRFERLKIITGLRIMYLQQVIKFVKNHKKYNFSVLDKKECINMFTKDKYMKFNKNLLDNPGFIPVDKMKQVICSSWDSKICVNEYKEPTYNYLFNIGPLQRIKDARDKRDKKLKELEIYYKKLSSSDIVKTQWIKELKELNIIIQKGTTDPKGWLYGERNVKFR